MIWRAAGPIRGSSSVASGFEPGTLRSQSRDITTRPPRPDLSGLVPRSRFRDWRAPGSQRNSIISAMYVRCTLNLMSRFRHPLDGAEVQTSSRWCRGSDILSMVSRFRHPLHGVEVQASSRGNLERRMLAHM
ncbi:hypothetical protein AVEN_187726-1 [Araneus ventricosus]|uniref:Uncharacterized protein n=1 Tax=Araneus ventricosus TaxID=182803 RepID=A0A4Y2C240_ARAVE|nr:hypothetical protein AVEN_187726-1 [Araneus ventricosus]